MKELKNINNIGIKTIIDQQDENISNDYYNTLEFIFSFFISRRKQFFSTGIA
jgi:hypothetical protein